MVTTDIPQTYSAFQGHRLLARGPLETIVIALKSASKKEMEKAPILLFSDLTGKQMDFDLHGSEKEILRRLQVYLVPEPSAESAPKSGPGRPRLGVVAREISLLPRHWEWLSTQSGGASATIRRLIEEARKTSTERDRVKNAQERVHRFLSAIAGDLPLFEEILRSLYKRDLKKVKVQMASWPADIRDYALRLANEN